MKPNFALSLSFEGIRLLHRAAGGWRVVGEVAVDADDLPGELAVLRRTATTIDPNDLCCKLLLPEEQIKYLTIDTPDMDDDARRDAARAALDDATPYPVDDLAFDICADGPLTHIAAVARETLIEAEGFAAEHHFNPIFFAAVPTDNPFLGEPFFGPTLAGAASLSEGEVIEADGIAVVIIGDLRETDTASSDGIEAGAEDTKDATLNDDSDQPDAADAAENEPEGEGEDVLAGNIAQDALLEDGPAEDDIAKDDVAEENALKDDASEDKGVDAKSDGLADDMSDDMAQSAAIDDQIADKADDKLEDETASDGPAPVNAEASVGPEDAAALQDAENAETALDVVDADTTAETAEDEVSSADETMDAAPLNAPDETNEAEQAVADLAEDTIDDGVEDDAVKDDAVEEEVVDATPVKEEVLEDAPVDEGPEEAGSVETIPVEALSEQEDATPDAPDTKTEDAKDTPAPDKAPAEGVAKDATTAAADDKPDDSTGPEPPLAAIAAAKAPDTVKAGTVKTDTVKIDTVKTDAPEEAAKEDAASTDAASAEGDANKISSDDAAKPDTASDAAGDAKDQTDTPEQTTPADTAKAAAPVRLTLGAARNVPADKGTGVAAPSVGFASKRADAPTIPPPPARREPSVTSPGLPGAPTPTVVAADSGGLSPVALKPLPVAEPEEAPARSSPLAAATLAAAPIGRFLSRRKAKAATANVVAQPAMAPTIAVPDNEMDRMTVFGARSSEVRGKPRFLGLMLTAALLVFLAGVAAWASVFLDDGLNLSRIFGDRTARETAQTTPTENATGSFSEAASSAQQPAPSEQPEGTVVTASLDPTLTPEDTAVLDALRETVNTPNRELTQQELEAHYATTGIWPQAPAVPADPTGLVNIDDLYLTTVDPVGTSNDAVALPLLSSFGTDAPLDALPSPAAAGTTFSMDARGLVIPTAAGALSPDGITVFAGRPPVTPPVTRARFQAVPQDDGVRSGLIKARPKLRPKDLSEQNERANLDGLTLKELASLRPSLRPRSIQQRADAAAAKERDAAKAAEQAAQEAAKKTEEAPAINTAEAVEAALAATTANANRFNNPTRLATKASARPDTRPRNFNRIVQRAKRAPKPKAQEETRVASVATVAPRTVKPKVPSKTSVARQATVKNAINLRKVNLIGVYGKPSNRRALVRLSNGRYKKVTVGDRIDGGRVNAISNTELRYTKSGRNVVLKMPR